MQKKLVQLQQKKDTTTENVMAIRTTAKAKERTTVVQFEKEIHSKEQDTRGINMVKEKRTSIAATNRKAKPNELRSYTK